VIITAPIQYVFSKVQCRTGGDEEILLKDENSVSHRLNWEKPSVGARWATSQKLAGYKAPGP